VRAVLPVLILIWGLARPATGEVPGSGISTRPFSDRWQLDFKLSLAEKKGSWVFAVDGFTDLPSQTVLRARVYVLDLVNDPVRGLHEDDDEALLREDDGIRPAFSRFTVGAGWFHVDVHSFNRKPYSIRYRAKIHYFPEDQTDAVRLKAGDEPFFRKADLRAGSEADYAAELKERLAEVTRQLMDLEKLGLELRGLAFQRPWNAVAWTRWKGPASDKIDVIRDENRRRYSIWAVWIEGQARMRVGALCEFLQHGIDVVDDGEALRDDERVRRLVNGFLESLDEACDVVGADMPLNPLLSGPALRAYEQALAALRQPGAPAAVLKKSRADALSALFDLASMLRLRRRGYASLNAMAGRLARVRELLDAKAPATDLQRALDEHDAAVREFKTFARLP